MAYKTNKIIIEPTFVCHVCINYGTINVIKAYQMFSSSLGSPFGALKSGLAFSFGILFAF